MDYKPLYELLLSGVLKKVRLSQTALKRLLKQSDFFSRLPRELGTERVCCASVMEACLPVMELLCPAPAEGWLKECYLELAHRLFPDPDRGKLSAKAAQAMEFYLTVLRWFLDTEPGRCPYDPLTDIPRLTPEELEGSLIPEEYPRWQQAVAAARFEELMRLGREIMPFDPASHTVGVHHMALHMGRQARKAGLPVDLPMVSAASLCHDIGKFGCRGEDAARIPYLHYYYTYDWLNRQGLPRIAHISANHSTWDLEFENLTLESLLLIYADFRVRGTREKGREVVRIYSLAESYDMIFSKLYNMTPEKQQRYKRVYLKLKDFETLLMSYGVRPEPLAAEMGPVNRPDATVLSQRDCLISICGQTLENNIRLMDNLARDVSFAQLLEQARGEKSLHRIRTYLRIFEEFSTYMTGPNKRRTLALLYELLMHHQGDVRRQSARIMGQILANSGPNYRKELPASAPQTASAPTTMAFLAESVELWERYMDLCLHPDYKIAAKHTTRISNSLKIIAGSLFAACQPERRLHYLEPLLARLEREEGLAFFVLTDSLFYLPLELLSPERLEALTALLQSRYEAGDEALRVLILRRLEALQPRLSEKRQEALRRWLRKLPAGESSAVQYLLRRIESRFLPTRPPRLRVASLYLSNLKTAVPWIVKLTQVDALVDDAVLHPENTLHTTMHLSNLLSVSEHLPVRERAGAGMLKLIDRLPLDQQNEIIVDLIRELETGQDEISVYIPRYLGQLMIRLPRKELEECLDYLRGLIRSSTERTATASLYTLGQILAALPEQEEDAARDILGILMAGVSHYNDTIHETAITVLCEQVLANDAIAMPRRQSWCVFVAKKLLCLLSEPRQGRFTFFTRAAVLNQLYRFLVECRVLELPFRYDEPRPLAFFPGTFDPFTTGHKRIVRELEDRGFEVYLAIDEFSWSKHPIAKLRRRQIASMSVADRMNVSLFPDEIPVNIAFPQDLARLRALFPGRELYLVTGSDVIRNASAYRSSEPGSAGDYNHIVFLRQEEDRESLAGKLRGKTLLVTLPEFYETVSSTRIREYVDQNMDISMLVEPMVQSYIFDHNLYLRAPQFKLPLRPQDLRLDYSEAEKLLQSSLTRRQDEALLWGLRGRTVTGAELYGILGDLDAAEYLRRHTSGRILLVEAVEDSRLGSEQGLLLALNELLARSLSSQHTYALCRAELHPLLGALLPQLGFLPLPERPDYYYVDMRTPMVLILDVLRRLKEPHRSDPAVLAAVEQTRRRLRQTLAALLPGQLLLSFDALLLDIALSQMVRRANGVADCGPEDRSLGPAMCVPYGRILAGELVPNTVTKHLHADKVFQQDIYHFEIRAMNGYSDLPVQVRTLASFHRPVILADDLLHKGFRLEKLEKLFREEGVEIRSVMTGILSGRGRDLMAQAGREVRAAYYIPNLLYWFNESLLYPFIGGDSSGDPPGQDGLLPTANLILPYVFPDYLVGVETKRIYELSLCALENARQILRELELCHQRQYGIPLTIHRLAEAFVQQRAPYRGKNLRYEPNALPSAYLADDIETFHRLRRQRE
ncbi:MAG: hypothetical protein IKQ04_04065 [Oscillospiraceae bacterium]|nr:hypothetical protein [Oscillospiraceae bacterium]